MIDPFYKQIYASVGVVTLYFSNGYLFAILSTILPDLRTSSIHLTVEQESWLPSILILMLFPSQLFSGLLTGRLGRKYLVFVSFIPPFISCILYYYAQNFDMFFVASLFAGLVGGGVAIGPMHIAEACSPKLRGVILNLKYGAFTLGLAAVHFLSNFFNWRSFVMYNLIFVICGMVTTATTPESPSWYASKGRFEECKKAFYWFRGDEDAAELSQLIECQERDQRMEKRNKRKPSSFKMNRSFLIAVSINVSTVLFVEVCGKQIFLAYIFDIVQSIIGNNDYVYYYALLFDVTGIIASVISCVLIRKYKRRMVLFSTGIPAVMILFAICALSYSMAHGLVPSKYSWVILMSFLVYFLILDVGASSVCTIIMPETYPLSHRGVGVAISSTLFMGFMFILTKISPSALQLLGIHGMFLICGVIISLALLHLYYFMPETDRKTLQDIENELNCAASSPAEGKQLTLEAEEKMLC